MEFSRLFCSALENFNIYLTLTMCEISRIAANGALIPLTDVRV